ncbi:MAG TPA: hypothetical protein H9877_09835, partial [Candidatus Gordonibacter avicola]|nr:hypothetical protein [Candidatus Gordonibacter avicola]
GWGIWGVGEVWVLVDVGGWERETVVFWGWAGLERGLRVNGNSLEILFMGYSRDVRRGGGVGLCALCGDLGTIHPSFLQIAIFSPTF